MFSLMFFNFQDTRLVSSENFLNIDKYMNLKGMEDRREQVLYERYHLKPYASVVAADTYWDLNIFFYRKGCESRRWKMPCPMVHLYGERE